MQQVISIYLGVYLKDAILDVLKKFSIEPYQLYTVTSDNGANMISAICLLEEETSLVSSDIQNETEEVDGCIFENLEKRNSENSLHNNSDDETR